MKRIILDLEEDQLAKNVAVLAARKGLSIEKYILWLLDQEVKLTALADEEYRRAEREYDNHIEGE